MSEDPMLSDESFIARMRDGREFRQFEISQFAVTHNAIDAQYDETGAHREFVRIYHVRDAYIAIPSKEADTEDGASVWHQPYEVQKVPVSHTVTTYRWLPASSSQSGAVTNDSTNASLMTDAIPFSEMSTREQARIRALLSNPAWYGPLSERIYEDDGMTETVRFIAMVTNDPFLLECVPQIQKWEEDGEEIPFRRIRELICERHAIDEMTQRACREEAERRLQRDRQSHE